MKSQLECFLGWLFYRLSLLQLVLAKPLGGSPTPTNEFRFIGFTDDAFNGLPDTIDGDEGMQ